jgi:rhodanese-related sulfurtransferase
MNAFTVITTSQLRSLLHDGSSFQFWNVLTDEYFHGEIIPGSRRVPLDKIGREVAAGHLPKTTRIVVYCSGPSCPQSKSAGEKLITLGYQDVLVFEGGLEQWREAGLPLEQVEMEAATA